MTYLQFKIGGACYAMATAAVEAVVAAVPLRPCPGAPDWLPGWLPYQGGVVPVADLTRRLTGQPSQLRLSTRILLIPHSRPDGGGGRFGLLAEGVTDTLTCAPARFSVSPPGAAAFPWLGPLASMEGEMVQLIYPERFLPPEVDAALFA
ncbi:MAG: chemotaxis protein CheW [Lentisphaeria bacterium]